MFDLYKTYSEAELKKFFNSEKTYLFANKTAYELRLSRNVGFHLLKLFQFQNNLTQRGKHLFTTREHFDKHFSSVFPD
jgi:hypothetical protein